ncbi:general stress protein [Evansella clarkii]|uniref:general stress protein n=1 Tax=Evansella clarkii TaxID=79879 RepID=UPI000995F8F2|nr:general stress protein [Evansella clarkii]
MAKKVIGVYESQQDIRQAVNSLRVEGYAPEEIALVAKDTEDKAWLRNQSGVSEENTVQHPGDNRDNEEEESFWDKVKSAFTPDNNKDKDNETKDFAGQFKDFGLSVSEAREYERDVLNGKVVVLADTVKRDAAKKENSKESLAERTSIVGGEVKPEDELVKGEKAPKNEDKKHLF